ncbi:aminotransferase class V-fold PLP-dependent enzyme [Staphylococcus epidermidis]|uniref:aminotransferase class V-fold PLP-dependent enzyme n=2 Tax=Staphylococcus epidermidis TaxID=1282 RepID=UPI0001CC58E1|nr:aminotransferase class V-fold PLP-dependent enzyme [Staphylococcus epidermidis]EFE58411.1 aminotransferase, class V [Staphylococcus epidermidis M23864:W2(grey)]MCO6278259.1 aminotransferase class V-fold PLP-dependent enzyme [Staphylococcus epidermidis]MDH9915719.1 aminotransferase class V-fold PLP-dependent enzyme [Staphylococcus epidermidis]
MKEVCFIKKSLYFNTGELSIVTNELKSKMIEEINHEFLQGRSKKGSRKNFQKKLDFLRKGVANIIGSLSEEITITDNTTMGINIVLNGINLQKDDEVVTTNMEHLASISPLLNLKERKGVVIKEIEVQEEGFKLEKLDRLFTKQTKLVVISHIFWKTGEVIPIKKVINLAHSKGIKVLVDGAQAVGSYPVDVRDLNVDFYCFPAHKWLYGPEGLGFLFVKKSIRNQLNTVFSGISSFEYFNNYNDFSIQDNGKKWELGTIFRPSVIGMINVLNYLFDHLSLEHINYKTIFLNGYMKELISEISNIKICSNNNYNIFTLILPKNINSKLLKEHLEKNSIFTKDIQDINALRVSLSFINDKSDIQILLKNILEYMEE